MPKLESEPLEAIQLRLYRRDLETLRALYGSTLGVNRTIRTIIRTFLKQKESRANITFDLVDN